MGGLDGDDDVGGQVGGGVRVVHPPRHEGPHERKVFAVERLEGGWVGPDLVHARTSP